MTDLITEGVTRLLLVEGPDDKQFFKRLLKHMQSKREIPFDLTCLKIRKFGGKNKLGRICLSSCSSRISNQSTKSGLFVMRTSTNRILSAQLAHLNGRCRMQILQSTMPIEKVLETLCRQSCTT